ncbi:MAG TPA: AraC family transcriptional regulator ligand-binding domain-containing protein, partial [Myxococcales bacterium]|nr:AraC family transcriptional regulator ligand-binding domain-containing protein [Myxococcales bacterium]
MHTECQQSIDNRRGPALPAPSGLAHRLHRGERVRATEEISAHPITVQATLLCRLARLGVDVREILREARIHRSRFEAPRARLTRGEFLGLWRAIELCGKSGVGLRLGAEAHQHNVAFAAALHTRNLAESLQHLGRYKQLTCSQEIKVDVSGGEARVHVQWLLAEGGLPPAAIVDGAFAAVA